MTTIRPIGKRAIKRLRLEGIVSRVEREKMESDNLGLVWKGISKSSLVKYAKVGKNYIDGLDQSDALAKRINLLIHRRETHVAKRDTELSRLERVRELEAQLIQQAESKAELVAENNRLRVDLTRSERRILAYERHYAPERPKTPSLRALVNRTEIIEFPTHEDNDG